MSENARIVCVVNNHDTFKRCIEDNIFVNHYDIAMFDNTKENISISTRYNTFIEKNIDENSDFWVIFIHQDFAFLQDPIEKLKLLPNDSIYGAVGMKNRSIKLPFLPEIKTPGRHLVGQIIQGENETQKIVGDWASENIEVKTLDCCCIMVHSTLLYGKKLRFDPKLDFHMYAEDFCISAAKKDVKSKVVQLKCRHLGAGEKNKKFYQCVKYVRAKHKIWRINSTCHT